MLGRHSGIGFQSDPPLSRFLGGGFPDWPESGNYGNRGPTDRPDPTDRSPWAWIRVHEPCQTNVTKRKTLWQRLPDSRDSGLSIICIIAQACLFVCTSWGSFRSHWQLLISAGAPPEFRSNHGQFSAERGARPASSCSAHVYERAMARLVLSNIFLGSR
jgi:hypothetical protein